MRVIECDRCHKRINKDAKKTGYINLDQRDIRTGDLDGNRDFDEWDLCDDCMKLIRQHSYMEDDLQKVDKWMAKNPKLAVYWGTIR